MPLAMQCRFAVYHDTLYKIAIGLHIAFFICSFLSAKSLKTFQPHRLKCAMPLRQTESPLCFQVKQASRSYIYNTAPMAPSKGKHHTNKNELLIPLKRCEKCVSTWKWQWTFSPKKVCGNQYLLTCICGGIHPGELSRRLRLSWPRLGRSHSRLDGPVRAH